MHIRLLVTGCAGFIGFHLCRRLLSEGKEVIGIDNLSDYYDVGLKESRLKLLREYQNFTFYKLDLTDGKGLEKLASSEGCCSEDIMVNLAAQAGIRYSLINPDNYINSNIIGFYNFLEMARKAGCRHLIYASSSSVYGSNTRLPYSEHDNVNHPISLYAATKKSNELLAHVCSYTYGIPITGLRFFTVYGPWGRPDMAYFKFTKAILENRPIQVFNRGGEIFRCAAGVRRLRSSSLHGGGIIAGNSGCYYITETDIGFKTPLWVSESHNPHALRRVLLRYECNDGYREKA